MGRYQILKMLICADLVTTNPPFKVVCFAIS